MRVVTSRPKPVNSLSSGLLVKPTLKKEINQHLDKHALMTALFVVSWYQHYYKNICETKQHSKYWHKKE